MEIERVNKKKETSFLGVAVVYSDFCREKLFQYRINRQSRPFIDNNLQIHLPDACSYPETKADHSCSPIYSYYAKEFPATDYLPFSNKEAELKQAMSEAEKSYQAWNRMRQQLLEAAQKYLSKRS